MILGFCGKMGSGKSTAVDIIKRITPLGSKVEVVKFAEPLYDIQEYIYSRIESAYQRPHTFIKDRKLLQWIGTEWGRGTISDSIWVDIWAAKVEKLRSSGSVILIADDVRFDNEARVLRALGGDIVQITSELTEKRIDTKAGIGNHASEAGLSPEYVNYIVKNNSSLVDFENSLAHMINVIKFKQEQ